MTRPQLSSGARPAAAVDISARRGRLSRYIPLLLLAAVAALSWLAVDPRGEFPLNDDWSYTSPVIHFLREGRLILSDWASPIALVHIAAGILFSKIFGFSYLILRLSTFLWSLGGIVFLYKILEEQGVAPAPRALACGLLFFNPIYFVLSFSFHTDVTFLFLALGAIYFFQRAERSGQARDEWAAGLLSALASITRQIGPVLPLAAVLWCLYHRRLTVGRVLRMLAPSAVALAAFYYWFLVIHGPTWAHVQYLSRSTFEHALDKRSFVVESLRRMMDSLLTCSLFAIPVIFFRSGEKKRVRAEILFAGLGFVIAVYVARKGLFPYVGNVFHTQGLGPDTLYDRSAVKPAFLWGSFWFWLTCTVMGATAFWIFLRRDAAAFRRAPTSYFLVLTGALGLATLIGSKYFDRYLLEWQVMLIIFLALRFASSRVPAASWAAGAILALLSLAGTRDYFIWNRAKWELGLAAAGAGIPPAEVANGFDWNAHWNYEKNMAELKKRKPLAEIKEWEWQEYSPIRAYISYMPPGKQAGEALMYRRYFSPLAPRGASLFLYRRSDPAGSVR